MSFSSVSGKNWIFNKFLESDLKKYSELYSLNEIVAKLLAIRRKNIDDVDLFLNPTIKNNLPKFLSTKVDNYKIYASIYKLFEYNNISPVEKTESHFNLVEHVTTSNKNNIQSFSDISLIGKFLISSFDITS